MRLPQKISQRLTLIQSSSTYDNIYTNISRTDYYYEMGGGYFDRPHRKAYRISIHKSFRKNGKVRKQQVSICTIGYYSIVDWGEWYQDFVNSSLLQHKLDQLGISKSELDSLICEKLKPVIERVKEEFQQTEEYRARMEHRRIIS